MSEETAPKPTPGPLGALLLTGFAWSVLVLVAALVAPDAGATPALALGMLLGFGGAGTLAARALPPPAERRIGLVGFAPRLLLPLMLLVPVVLLASELDNQVAAQLFPGAKAAATPDPAPGALDMLQWVLLTVLLQPVLEEFFFRGVVQQGVVAALGSGRGVLLAAVLFALVRTSLFAPDAYHATSLGLQALCTGVLLGFVRLASGSILPGILLLTAIEGVGVLSYALREALPIAGFNAGGPHTPLALLLPAALCVATGLLLLARHSRQAGR